MNWYSARLQPKIYQWSYLGRRDILKGIRNFIHKEIGDRSDYVVMDLGCGDAPYKKLFPKVREYIGVDIFTHPSVNIVASMWKIPLDVETIDIVLCTETLEHSEKVHETIAEIYRLLKPGGKAFFSIPFLYPVHGEDDRWRFTEYGLKELFHRFDRVEIHPTNSFFTTIGQLCNALLANIPLGRFFFPLSFVLNILAILADKLLLIFVQCLKLFFTKKNFLIIQRKILTSFSLRYTIVVEKILQDKHSTIDHLKQNPQ